MRDGMRRKLALGLFTVALIIMPTASPAFAGDSSGVAAPPETDVTLIQERAIVSLEDGIQTTNMLLEVSSTTASAGLIIPTPTPAIVSAGNLADFDAVERAMLPRPSYVEDWWGLDTLVEAARNENPTIPAVLNRVQLGPVEATTLAATDSAGLLAWLQANGFELPSTATELLAPYVTAGWSFVTIKLSGNSVITGTLDPVRLSFETAELVYPVRLFQGDTEPHPIRLYVIDDNRVELVRSATATATSATTPTSDTAAVPQPQPVNAAQKVVWAARLLPGEPQAGRFLTVFDVRFDFPATQANSDIYFARAKANDHVTSSITVVTPMTLLGIPFGTVLVGSVALALLVLILVFIARVRVR